jgi:hypothetical protein
VELLARNAPGCKVAYAPTAVLDAWQGRTSSAKYATAPTSKECNSVSNAKSSHAKTPSKDPLVSVTASTFRANPKSLDNLNTRDLNHKIILNMLRTLTMSVR